MENERAHDFLKALDSMYGREVESPDDFKYEDEVRHVQKIKRRLEKILGVPLQVDTASAQDSYFFAEIQYSSQDPGDPNLLLNVRFSSFGKLVSAWVRKRIPAKVDDVLGAIREVVESEGYLYLDSDWLIHTRYDGDRFPTYSGNMTWWRRFFDYL